MMSGRGSIHEVAIAAATSLLAALVFYFSTRATLHDLDYTNQIAWALLHGRLGLVEKPPGWLNEMIPWGNRYYSAFPLGAVLSMVPVALLRGAGLIESFPGHVISAAVAGLSVYFFFQLYDALGSDYAGFEIKSLARRIMLALFPVFGTWTWCNLGFAGAWQIALGLAVLGQTAALYFTLVRPSPFLAGIFFALAFGNRTELIITLPLYLYFFWRQPDAAQRVTGSNPAQPSGTTTAGLLKRHFQGRSQTFVLFLIVPAILGLLTAAYNWARFHSIFDFGYMHIPEVREEPWYAHGLFSIHAIPLNVYTMLFQGFDSIDYFPYIRPNGFGCSILLASPFLCLLFRQGGRYNTAAWVAIATLTVVLWMHGNPGSWQFSYRYAMILLPWMFLLLAGNGPPKINLPESALFAVSVAINATAMWLFLWTEQIQP